MTPGLMALVAALAVSLAGGAIWRRTNGRMHSPGAPRATASVAGVPVMTMDAADPAMPPDARDTGRALSADQLGHPLGERATLLQFSSAFCAPCRATRRILEDVVAETPGVAHVEVDAEHHLELVRRAGVVRTPTTLVLDAAGVEVERAGGVPRRDAVLTALVRVVDGQ